MRNTTISLFAALLALAIAATANAQPKIVVVDLEKLIRLHPNTAEDKKLLEATLKNYNKQKEQLKALAASTAKAFEAAYAETKNPALSEAARKKAEDAMLEKRKAALEADRNASEKIREMQRDLNAQELKMLKRTSDLIEAEIGEYAREKDLYLVLQLPSKLSPGTGVVYSKPEMDITAEIMKRLNIPDEEPVLENDAPDGEKDKPAEKDAKE